MKAALVLCILAPLAAAQLPGSDINVNNFDVVDANKDGVVSHAEFDAWGTKHLHHLKAADRKLLFTNYDSDHDGKLIVAEFVPLAFAISQKPVISSQTVFERLDKNGDGVIDLAERGTSGVDALVLAGLLQVADINGDGLLSKHEFEMAVDEGRQKTQEEKNREQALQLFADLDANRDGKLSKAEVRGFALTYTKATEADVTSAFAAIDLNHDGAIDIPELSRLPSKIATFVNFQAPPPVKG